MRRVLVVAAAALVAEAFVLLPPPASTCRRVLLRPSRAPAPRAYTAVPDASAAPDATATIVPPPPLPETTDPFVLLDIDPSSDWDLGAIKSAYYRRVKMYHPDTTVTRSTPEEVVQRINADFNTIQAAYEELRERFAQGETDVAAGTVFSQYGYGQSVGPQFQTSFDTDAAPARPRPPPAKRPAAARRQQKATRKPSAAEAEQSAGFVGFVGDEDHETGAQTNAGFVGFRNDDKWPTHTGSQAPSAAASPAAAAARTSAQRKVAAQRKAAPPPPPAAARSSAQRKVASSPVNGTAQDAELALYAELAVYRGRCKALEKRLQRAEVLAQSRMTEKDVLVQMLERAECVADAAIQDKALLEEELAAAAAAHAKDTAELVQNLERLEAELQESTRRPWYNSERPVPRTTDAADTAPPVGTAPPNSGHSWYQQAWYNEPY